MFRLKSYIAWYRVQAFIQQLVDTRPDMVTREVVGKTIVSLSTSTGTKSINMNCFTSARKKPGPSHHH